MDVVQQFYGNARRMKMAETQTQSDVLQNGLKLVSEAVITPGASLILEGRIMEGALHAVVAVAAGALLGPVGVFLTAANSYSMSTTGKNLQTQIADAMRSRSEPAASSTSSPYSAR